MPRRNIEDREVAAADPAGLDLNQHLAGRGNRFGPVLQLQGALSEEHGSEHDPVDLLGQWAAVTLRRRRSERRARPATMAIAPASPSAPSVNTRTSVATALTSGVTPNLICV